MSKNSLKRQKCIRVKSCLNWVLLGKVIWLWLFSWLSSYHLLALMHYRNIYVAVCYSKFSNSNSKYSKFNIANYKTFHNTTILNHSKNYNRKSRAVWHESIDYFVALSCFLIFLGNFSHSLKKQMKTFNTVLTPTCLKLEKPGKRNIVCYRW